MTPGRRWKGWWIACAVFVVAADQLSKRWVSLYLDPGESIPLCPGLHITHHTNTGAAFGLLGNAPVFLTALSALLIAGLFFYTRHRLKGPDMSAAALCGLILVFSGAVGNLADRLRLGHVVDFIDVGFWPVFNLADSAITIGAALMALAILKDHEPSQDLSHRPGG
ncbi:MAG: signal peptidase II [Candidatus Omnitrophica bacterium]|nr:signal peptidase II [Candidatus Omnitrophota bacterium]